MINNSAENQDYIFHRFSDFKTRYVNIKNENKILKETIDLLTTRLKIKDERNFKLIKLLKERTDKYSKCIKSLEESNCQLETLAEEQRQSIRESAQKIHTLETNMSKKSDDVNKYLDEISRLKEEVYLLKEKRNKEIKSHNNENTLKKTIQSVRNKNIPALRLDHPCFSVESKISPIKRNKKYTSQKKESRWPNLNITISSGSLMKDINSSTLENNSSSPLKRKKLLYRSNEDIMVDLSNDEME